MQFSRIDSTMAVCVSVFFVFFFERKGSMRLKRTKKVQRNVKRKFVLSAGFDKLQLCDLFYLLILTRTGSGNKNRSGIVVKISCHA